METPTYKSGVHQLVHAIAFHSPSDTTIVSSSLRCTDQCTVMCSGCIRMMYQELDGKRTHIYKREPKRSEKGQLAYKNDPGPMTVPEL